MDERLADLLAERISGSQRVVAFSGAGISAESGIPTFRGEGGIWEQYSPALYGNIPGMLSVFLFRPSRLHRFFLEAISTFVRAEPNAGHHALAGIERRGHLRSVITQNVDDLHERSGHGRVIKLHGDLYRFRCLGCGTRAPLSREEGGGIGEALGRIRSTRRHLVRSFRQVVPACPSCGGRMRPDVVFFGESLPREDLSEAMEEARTCEIMLVIGTSGVVYPAASIPQVARENGALIAEVGTEPTAMTAKSDLFLKGPAGEVLPEIARRLS